MSLLSPKELESISKRYLSEADFDAVDHLEDGEYVFTIKTKSAIIAIKIPLAGTKTKVTNFYISIHNAHQGQFSSVVLSKLGDDFSFIIRFLKIQYKNILIASYRNEVSNLNTQYSKIENTFKEIFAKLENKT